VQVFFDVLGEVVFVNKVIARVVRWVDVDQLHLAEVALLEQFEHLEVVALNKEITRGVKVHALVGLWPQRFAGRRVGGENRLALARPIQLVALGWPLYNHAREFLAEQVEVDFVGYAAVVVVGLGHALWEELADQGDIALAAVRRLHVE
jgi:hypothetical protein